MNIYDLISRAQKLRKETQLDSVSPDRVGGLHEDTLKYINEFQLLASSPSLHKIYASVSAMQSDKSPKSDLTGKPLKPGQLVVIVPANQTDATAGDVYRYDGPSGNTSAWTFVAKIGAVPADAELSATSTNPPQNKVVTEKLTELESEVRALEAINLIDNTLSIQKGYYDDNGNFIANDGFTAAEVAIKPLTKYVYRGGLFGGMCIVITRADGSIIQQIKGSDSHETPTTTIEFTTFRDAAVIKVCSFVSNNAFPLGLFEFGLAPEAFQKYSSLGGYTNLLNIGNTEQGYYILNGDIIQKGYHKDIICAKIRLAAGKTYVVAGSINFNACMLSKKDSGKATEGDWFQLNGYKVISSPCEDVDLYYTSVISPCDFGTPSLAGVYEVILPSQEEKTFRANSDNFVKGFYFFDSLAYQDISANNIISYQHSKPIEVQENQKYKYHGAGVSALAAVLSCDSMGNPDGVFKLSTGADTAEEYVTKEFVVPSGVKYLIIQSMVNPLVNISDIWLDKVSSDNGQTINNIAVTWTIPSKIYALKGQEKSIYFDNIVNRNDDAHAYSIEVFKTFGHVDGRRFYFTPTSVGNISVVFNAWAANNELVSTKVVNIEVVDNEVAEQKRILCIGDSITEGLGQGDTQTNMPYHIKKGMDNFLVKGADNVIFVGSKGSEVKHEGWWGRSYQWLANDLIDPSQSSPLVNPSTNQLDVAYYRTNHCGLSASQKIDVVNLAMGFNNTNTQGSAEASFASLQKIIEAFKADNPNTKFIVHLVTYPAMGNVNQVDEEQRTEKKNSLYYFRQLCIAAYNNSQDSNVMIGDLGLGYDRWYAYNRNNVHPASYYDEDTMQVITDRVHPSYRGAKQMGENIIPCIIKALNL